MVRSAQPAQSSEWNDWFSWGFSEIFVYHGLLEQLLEPRLAILIKTLSVVCPTYLVVEVWAGLKGLVEILANVKIMMHPRPSRPVWRGPGQLSGRLGLHGAKASPACSYCKK
jgi:hypothetical protein